MPQNTTVQTHSVGRLVAALLILSAHGLSLCFWLLLCAYVDNTNIEN